MWVAFVSFDCKDVPRLRMLVSPAGTDIGSPTFSPVTKSWQGMCPFAADDALYWQLGP
jgi:hypothetical protein